MLLNILCKQIQQLRTIVGTLLLFLNTHSSQIQQHCWNILSIQSEVSSCFHLQLGLMGSKTIWDSSEIFHLWFCWICFAISWEGWELLSICSIKNHYFYLCDMAGCDSEHHAFYFLAFSFLDEWEAELQLAFC